MTQTFPQFSLLPAEIRCMIWRGTLAPDDGMAYPVGSTWRDCAPGGEYRVVVRLPTPAALYVCSEARVIARSWIRERGAWMYPLSQESGYALVRRWDAERDFLYVPRERRGYLESLITLTNTTGNGEDMCRSLETVRHLALPAFVAYYSSSWVAMVAANLPNLEKVYVLWGPLPASNFWRGELEANVPAQDDVAPGEEAELQDELEAELNEGMVAALGRELERELEGLEEEEAFLTQSLLQVSAGGGSDTLSLGTESASNDHGPSDESLSETDEDDISPRASGFNVDAGSWLATNVPQCCRLEEMANPEAEHWKKMLADDEYEGEGSDGVMATMYFLNRKSGQAEPGETGFLGQWMAEIPVGLQSAELSEGFSERFVDKETGEVTLDFVPVRMLVEGTGGTWSDAQVSEPSPGAGALI